MTYLDVGSPPMDPGPDKGRKNRDKTPTTRVNRYWKEIEAYNKAASDWVEQSNKIVKLYLDQTRTAYSPRRFALLWSNIEVQKPAVYAKLPTMLCSRRYKDPAPVGRVAAELLESATNTTFDLYNADEVFRMVRDDRLLCGRGQAWVRYEAAFDQEGEGDNSYEKVAGEKVCVDYVSWQDFGHNVAGTWHDVWCVWRIVHKTHDEMEERFGTTVAEKVSYSAQDRRGGQDRGRRAYLPRVRDLGQATQADGVDLQGGAGLPGGAGPAAAELPQLLSVPGTVSGDPHRQVPDPNAGLSLLPGPGRRDR